MFSRTKITFSNLLWCYLGILVIVIRYFFSFFLKFVLAQFKSIPTEFKYSRDSNGLKILLCTPTKTDARIHSKGMFLCIGGLPNSAYMNHLRAAGAKEPLTKIAKNLRWLAVLGTMWITFSLFLGYFYVTTSVQFEKSSHNDKSFPEIPSMPGLHGLK